MTSTPVQIGEGIFLESVVHGDDEHPAGFIFVHGTCRGALIIDDAHFPHKWNMTGDLEEGTLTLEPSVQCTSHPEVHGYIRNSQWVSV